MHEPPNISADALRVCLHDQYALSAGAVEFLPNDQNTYAGTYRVLSAQGTAYLLKASSAALYEPSCLVPRYLQDEGIAFVVAPLPTRIHTVWTHIEAWTVCLYPFIDGASDANSPMTDDQWKATGTTLHHIHHTAPPPSGVGSLRTETFDPTEYRQWIDAFEAQHVSRAGASPVEQELHATWEAHRATIYRAMNALEALAPTLHAHAGSYVICHADLHPSNLIRDPRGPVYVIDWDDVMLAPKERDFLFVADPPADASDTISPFFQGYGPTLIDWRALTYYRWERVVQDLIEYARNVCFRVDLGAAAQMESVQQVRAILEEGAMIQAAQAAASHLPVDLRFPGQAA